MTGTVGDDDTSGVLLSETHVYVTEHLQNDEYKVVLKSEPTEHQPDPFGYGEIEEPASMVTLTIVGDEHVAVSPSVLTFSYANWDKVQTVTVRAIDDLDDEEMEYHAISHYSNSSDYNYQSGVPFSPHHAINTTVTDNDNAGVVIDLRSGNLRESGVTGNYSIVLDSQPRFPVTVTVDDADSRLTASAGCQDKASTRTRAVN